MALRYRPEVGVMLGEWGVRTDLEEEGNRSAEGAAPEPTRLAGGPG